MSKGWPGYVVVMPPEEAGARRLTFVIGPGDPPLWASSSLPAELPDDLAELAPAIDKVVARLRSQYDRRGRSLDAEGGVDYGPVIAPEPTPEPCETCPVMGCPLGHPQDPARPLLTVDDLAEQLRVSTATLNLWHRKGQGPHRLKLGGQVRYRQADVDRWLDSDPRPAPRKPRPGHESVNA
jgi:predicted DNA-binding transcriptional regulator AlpA